MKIFIVNSNNNELEAGFTTEEKAIAYIANNPDEFTTEELELDTKPPPVFGYCWTCFLDVDGRFTQLSSHSQRPGRLLRIPERYQSGERGYSNTTRPIYLAFSPGQGVFSGTSYVSWDHAVELAKREREKSLAEHPEWFVKESVS